MAWYIIGSIQSRNKWNSIETFISSFIPLISRVRSLYRKLWAKFFSSFYSQSVKSVGMKTRKGKTRIHNLPEQTRLITCLLYGFVNYFGKGTKLFDILTGIQELEVCTATY